VIEFVNDHFVANTKVVIKWVKDQFNISYTTQRIRYAEIG